MGFSSKCYQNNELRIDIKRVWALNPENGPIKIHILGANRKPWAVKMG
jgi:hypothetical protein